MKNFGSVPVYIRNVKTELCIGQEGVIHNLTRSDEKFWFRPRLRVIPQKGNKEGLDFPMSDLVLVKLLKDLVTPLKGNNA